MAKVGKVKQIIGAVVEVNLRAAFLRYLMHWKLRDMEIRWCWKFNTPGRIASTIAMDGTEGLTRGVNVVDAGAPIKMPAGDAIKGRLFNVTGDPIDGLPPVPKVDGRPIHSKPPAFANLSTATEILYTGIKVIDLIEPYAKGGKIGLFGGAGVGKTVLIQEQQYEPNQ